MFFNGKKLIPKFAISGSTKYLMNLIGEWRLLRGKKITTKSTADIG